MEDLESTMTYMDYLWLTVEDDIVTVGINDEGLEGFDSIAAATMPAENTTLAPDEVCGELDTDQGPVNLYCPIDGVVIEINEAVVQNPMLIIDDSYGDGWLFKIEAEDHQQIIDLPEHIKGEQFE